MDEFSRAYLRGYRAGLLTAAGGMTLAAFWLLAGAGLFILAINT